MNAAHTDALIRRVAGWSAGRRLTAHRVLMQRAPLFDMELSATCNLSCAFCPRTAIARRARRMSDKTFDALLDFLPEDAVAMLSGLGEATLDPALPDRVRRLTERGVSTCIITNGVLLTPALQRALFRAGIAQLQVSVHGLTEDDLSRVILRGAQPSRVRANLEHLARHRPPEVRVRINVVETEHNAAAIHEVFAFAHRLGFQHFWRRQHNRGGSAGATDRVPHGGCGIFASVTFISVDGQVLPCVNDVAGRYGPGNIRALTCREVMDWKGEVIARDRWFPPCATCNDDYRWVLLGQGRLDEPPAAAASSHARRRRPRVPDPPHRQASGAEAKPVG